MGRTKTGNPLGRPSGTYGADVMAVIQMEPGNMIRFRVEKTKVLVEVI